MPAEVYKKYAKTLVSQLKQTELDALELGCLPPSLFKATIILLLKQGKEDLGYRFIKWVQLLHSAHTARLRINGDLSHSFHLFRGTRQGCPLSPLFALALETLAEAVRASSCIKGFLGGYSEDKISLYADDTLLYLGDTDSSLQNVMCLIEKFGVFFSFSINWSKSALLLLDELLSQNQNVTGPFR